MTSKICFQVTSRSFSDERPCSVSGIDQIEFEQIGNVAQNHSNLLVREIDRKSFLALLGHDCL